MTAAVQRAGPAQEPGPLSGRTPAALAEADSADPRGSSPLREGMHASARKAHAAPFQLRERTGTKYIVARACGLLVLAIRPMHCSAMQQLYVETRADWRRWLGSHHRTESQGVWLVFYRKGSRHPTLNYDEAVEEALCFGWVDSVIRKIDSQRYCRKFTPRRRGSRWSAMNRRRAEELIASKKMTRSGLEVIHEAKRSGSWYARPPAAIAPQLPPELAEALRPDRKAQETFEGLAPSYQKQFIGWISTAKKSVTRARRVSESIERLQRGEKLGMK